jgi:hypothetical protein
MRDVLTKREKQAIKVMAENAVSIKEGEKVGRWTREDRVAVVYSVLCSLFRMSKQKKKQVC